MTAHRGLTIHFHPYIAPSPFRFHPRLKMQRHDNLSRNRARKLSVNILQKIVHVLVARLLLTVRARFDAEAEPGRSVFLPRITIEAGGITRWVTKKAKLPVLTHDDSKQWSDKTRFNGEKRAGPVIKGSVSITNTGRDWERGKKGKKGRERNYARYYPLFLRVEEKKRSLMRNSLAVGNSFYFAINAISVGLVIYLRAEDFVDEASLARL